MKNSLAPSTSHDSAADLARRLGVILLGLAAVMARRFLKNPKLVALIVPLWRRITRIAGRFERAVARPARLRAARTGGASGARPQGLRLPSGRGWLVRELGYEAAGHGLQLAHVLAEPEMQALIAANPAVGRVLRPICRMLGYELAAVTTMVAPAVVVAAPGLDAAAAAPMVRAVWSETDGPDLVGISENCSDFAMSG